MKRRMAMTILLGLMAGLWSPTPSYMAPISQAWNFESNVEGSLPEDFEVGTLFDGRQAGDWKIVREDTAPSPNHVLGQVMNKGAEHAYKVVLLRHVTAGDLEVSVWFLAVAGKGDMGGGLMWRAADDRNYYLTRANPLEQNVRIYRVVKGVRHLLQNFDQIIEVNKWHTLRVAANGCRLQVFYDEKPVFDLCDPTFTGGRIGLWTKSDAVTYFDDLNLQILK